MELPGVLGYSKISIESIVDESENPIKEETSGEYGKKFTTIPKPRQVKYNIPQKKLVEKDSWNPIYVPEDETKTH